MMNVTVIAVGKLKERFLNDGCKEYGKRMSAFCKLHIVEIDEERCSDNPTDSQIKQTLNKEGKRILEKIPKGTYVIALCIEGKEYSSMDFSKMLSDIAMENNHVVFVIGGSFGLSSEIKQSAKCLFSFGKMTLPHQLARLVLLEQTYRAFSISNNLKYHK